MKNTGRIETAYSTNFFLYKFKTAGLHVACHRIHNFMQVLNHVNFLYVYTKNSRLTTKLVLDEYINQGKRHNPTANRFYSKKYIHQKYDYILFAIIFSPLLWLINRFV